jgi:hypothetical protein
VAVRHRERRKEKSAMVVVGKMIEKFAIAPRELGSED